MNGMEIKRTTDLEPNDVLLSSLHLPVDFLVGEEGASTVVGVERARGFERDSDGIELRRGAKASVGSAGLVGRKFE
jgi:hypothetical protein